MASLAGLFLLLLIFLIASGLILSVPAVLGGWALRRFLPPSLGRAILLLGVATLAYLNSQWLYSYTAPLVLSLGAGSAGWLLKAQRKRWAALALVVGYAPVVLFWVKVGHPDFALNLENGYRLYRMNGCEIYVAPGSRNNPTAMVPPNIIKIAWTSGFVLAETEPGCGRTTPGDSSSTGDHRSVYWILNLRSPWVMGPLDEETFTEVRARYRLTYARLVTPQDFMWRSLYLLRNFD